MKSVGGLANIGLATSGCFGSELVLDGCFSTIDLRCFGYERVLEKRPLFEKNIV